MHASTLLLIGIHHFDCFLSFLLMASAFYSVVAGYLTLVKWEEVRWCWLLKNVLDPPFHFLWLSGHACREMLSQWNCQPMSGFFSSLKFRCVKYFLSTKCVKGMVLAFRVDPCGSCLKKAKVYVGVWNTLMHSWLGMLLPPDWWERYRCAVSFLRDICPVQYTVPVLSSTCPLLFMVMFFYTSVSSVIEVECHFLFPKRAYFFL